VGIERQIFCLSVLYKAVKKMQLIDLLKGIMKRYLLMLKILKV